MAYQYEPDREKRRVARNRDFKEYLVATRGTPQAPFTEAQASLLHTWRESLEASPPRDSSPPADLAACLTMIAEQIERLRTPLRGSMRAHFPQAYELEADELLQTIGEARQELAKLAADPLFTAGPYGNLVAQCHLALTTTQRHLEKIEDNPGAWALRSVGEEKDQPYWNKLYAALADEVCDSLHKLSDSVGSAAKMTTDDSPSGKTLTRKEAAAELGCDPAHISRLLTEKSLKGRKVHGQWEIEEQSVNVYHAKQDPRHTKAVQKRKEAGLAHRWSCSNCEGDEVTSDREPTYPCPKCRHTAWAPAIN